MAATADTQAPRETPTGEAPEPGVVAIAVDRDTSVDISEVEHWVEEGLHVFRSTEFDCIAHDEDEWEAVRVFLETAEDYGRYLSDLADADRATDDELRMLVKLSQRFYEVYRADREAELRRRIRSWRSRNRRIHSSTWRRRTTPSSSSLPSPA